MEGLLLNPNSGTIDLSILDSLERNPCFSHLSEDDGPPTREEILKALKKSRSRIVKVLELTESLMNS